MEVIHLADARKNQKFGGMSLMLAIFFTHFLKLRDHQLLMTG